MSEPLYVRVDIPTSLFHTRVGWLVKTDPCLVYFPGEVKPLRFDREHLVLVSSLCPEPTV